MTDQGAVATPVRACYRHPGRETYVACTRCGRPICPACMRPAAVGFHCPEEGRGDARPSRLPRTVLGGRVSQGRPVATLSIIGVNVAVFLATSLHGISISGVNNSSLYLRFSLIPYEVALNHQYYRLVTAMFLHYDLIHIGLNMYCLYLMGPPLERVLGRTRYVALYLIAGLGGSALVYLIAPSVQETAGASGAIFGLFGAFWLIARRLRINSGPIVATIVLNLVFTFVISDISWQDHIGGLVVGSALGAALAYAPRRHQALVQAGACAAALVILVVALVARTHSLDASYGAG